MEILSLALMDSTVISLSLTELFLSRNKMPPIATTTSLFQIHATKHQVQKYIRTDEGGKLWGSNQFQWEIADAGFILELTTPDSSFQNDVAEWPNRTLGDMMQSLLHNANLGPQYWSWALIHATYLKNIIKTPYEAYTGNKPDITKLRVFGCPIIVRLPGKWPAKLDTHATIGVFLGYMATDRNIYYQDTLTNRIKIANHMTFDEAGYTLSPLQKTDFQQDLQNQAFPNEAEQPMTVQPQCLMQCLYIKKLSDSAILPQRATEGAAGYDICSPVTITLPLRTLTPISTDLTMTPPMGTYCQILSRSGLLLHHGI